MALPELPVLRVLVVFEAEADLNPGRFGFAVGLRGAFERALTEIACVQATRDCPRCPVSAGCPIPGWLSPSLAGQASMTRPYALRVLHASGSRLSAEWVFFGRPAEAAGVSLAFRRMARRGLGANDAPARLALVEALGADGPVVVWDDDREVGALPVPGVLPQFARAEGDAAVVTLTSPLQLVPTSDAPEAPAPSLLVVRTIERLRQLCRATDTPLPERWPEVPEALGLWRDVRFRPGHRWSERAAREIRGRRQRAGGADGHIDLSGWTGRIEYPEAGPWAELIAAAEVVQVGRHTTEGLGAVEVDWT